MNSPSPKLDDDDRVHPIQFCLDESKFRRGEDIIKTKLFSDSVPLAMTRIRAYPFENEEEYYREYATSLFAHTHQKLGWDCLRHHEIIAAGCIPYFHDIESCPSTILPMFPKTWVREAMTMAEESSSRPIATIVDDPHFMTRYTRLRDRIFEHALDTSSGRAIARYIMDTVSPGWERLSSSHPITVLFLSSETSPDYLRCLVLTGMKRLLGSCRVVDVPKIPHIYTTFPEEDAKALYGRGFSYTRILDTDPDLDRSPETIGRKIASRYYDLVVYGSIHRGTPFQEMVLQHYREEEVVYLCGEDFDTLSSPTNSCIDLRPPGSHLFVRELLPPRP